MRRYDVVAYDGAGDFPPLEIRDVARTKIPGALRELVKARGVALHFAVIYRHGESVIVGAALRGGQGWSVTVQRDGGE